MGTVGSTPPGNRQHPRDRRAYSMSPAYPLPGLVLLLIGAIF
jgi:hypothetical protein